MGKHDSKQQKLQVDIIDNKNDAVEYIQIRKKLRGSEGFDNDDPNDYVQKKDVEGLLSGGQIKSWIPGTVAELGECLTHQVSGTIYLFRSTEEDNEVEPALPVVGVPSTWDVIGLYPKYKQYTGDAIDADGNIDVSSQAPGLRGNLLGVLVTQYDGDGNIIFMEPADSKYYPWPTAKVNNLANWLDVNGDPLPNLVIDITFI